MPNRRNHTADLLKGTAIVLMIQVHVMELFAKPEIQASAVGKASLFLGGPPVAPVFMVVMGYFVLASRRTTAELIVRAASLLAIGMALNVGLNLHLLIKIWQGTFRLDPWQYVLGVDILFLAGIATTVVATLRPALKRHWWSWLLLAITIVAASPYLVEPLTVESSLKWPLAYLGGEYAWSYFSVFPWLAYPFLGAAVSAWHARAAENSLPAAWTSVAWCAASAGLIWTGKFAMDTSHNLPAYYNHGLPFFAWTVTFLFAWTLVVSRFDALASHPVGRWLSWMGRNVTACYVVQWLIIGNTATAIYKTESLLHCGLWFVSIVVATCIVIFALRGAKKFAFARRES